MEEAASSSQAEAKKKEEKLLYDHKDFIRGFTLFRIRPIFLCTCYAPSFSAN